MDPNEEVEEATPVEPKPKSTRPIPPIPELPPVEDSEWSQFGLHDALLYSLSAASFTTPTPVQAATLPKTLHKPKRAKKTKPTAADKLDLMGIAQTGSGKTLAYLLPILQSLLPTALKPIRQRSLDALIVVPTRELATQITSVLSTLLKPINTPGSPPVISVGTLVGGMAIQKQQRILARGVDILVGTPGRVWEFLQDYNFGDAKKEFEESVDEATRIKWLVLDEADRLVAKNGSFSELEGIIRVARASHRLVFSASMDRAALMRTKKKIMQKRPDQKDPNMLSALLDRLPDFSPQVVNVSSDSDEPEKSVSKPNGLSSLPSTLKAYVYPCLPNQKDLVLYYFLLRHPGRTLVFLPSISHIRRLLPLLCTLLCSSSTPANQRQPVHALHSSLPQPTRLSALQQFTKHPKGVLLATDVAARGLDVADIGAVIHYCPAESPAAYLHRCGRTARAGASGLTLTLVDPVESKAADALWRAFKEPERWESEMDGRVTEALKKRVALARNIEGAAHKIKKAKADGKWMKEAAEVLGVDYEEEEHEGKGKQAARQDERMKDQLATLLKKPLVARGISTRYLDTATAQEMLAGSLCGIQQ
ncbi:P-loop containing nucleoside triphosphate hydrolase protein [Cylindrobasidium torrendii FP15055 ss-10]|uniref:ATP-dependent RNA helicase n=1 Tax=Cylindrobasidium torrendii FP15055 ss-10 TaxID=1314674 RepID=A0A0D7B9D3_9AGAR|nr:P-loop containing nucleoside triphosphate hydrolase protein [Cylindrobasidium torrendii FP15055 ss-10]